MKKANAKSQFFFTQHLANLPMQTYLFKDSKYLKVQPTFFNQGLLDENFPEAIENKRVLSSPTPPRMQHLKIALETSRKYSHWPSPSLDPGYDMLLQRRVVGNIVGFFPFFHLQFKTGK